MMFSLCYFLFLSSMQTIMLVGKIVILEPKMDFIVFSDEFKFYLVIQARITSDVTKNMVLNLQYKDTWSHGVGRYC